MTQFTDDDEWDAVSVDDPAREWWSLALATVVIIGILLCCGGCAEQVALFNLNDKQDAKVVSQRDQCRACAKQAADQENRTYKQSVAEMKAVHEREQKRIKAQYDACPAGEAVVMSGPSAGATIVTTPTIPDAGEVLPPSGIMKDIQKPCKD